MSTHRIVEGFGSVCWVYEIDESESTLRVSMKRVALDDLRLRSGRRSDGAPWQLLGSSFDVGANGTQGVSDDALYWLATALTFLAVTGIIVALLFFN